MPTWEESLLPNSTRPLAKAAGSIAAIQPHIPLRKINQLVFTAEQHFNPLKIFAEIGLTDHRSPSGA
jgi:hypothetical protein